MTYFKKHMTYREILATLSDHEHASSNPPKRRDLHFSEIRCLNFSMVDPLVQELMQRYPLPQNMQHHINASVQRSRALHGDIYNPLYVGQFDRIPVEPLSHDGINTHQRLKELVQRVIQGANTTFNERLINAEQNRFRQRQQHHAQGNLQELMAEMPLEAIKQDFLSYAENLLTATHDSSVKDHINRASLALLQSLFQYIDTLPNNSPEKESAETLLVEALDQARTAYHAHNIKYVPGKDYDSPTGVMEGLLEVHAALMPQPAAESSPLIDFVDKLVTPFIVMSESQTPIASEQLYHIFLEAAGYQIKTRLLKEGEQPIAELIPPASAPETENILSAMLNSGAFLDMEHLQMVLYITGNVDLITLQQRAKAGHIPESKKLLNHASQKALESLHRSYLNNGDGTLQQAEKMLDNEVLSHNKRYFVFDFFRGIHLTEATPFCHFYDEPTIKKRLLNCKPYEERSFIPPHVSESALCSFLLDSAPKSLDSTTMAQISERLLVFLVEEGYAKAITILSSQFSKYHINQQDFNPYSLLFKASERGYTETVKALIAAGLDHKTSNDVFYSPLIVAFNNDHTDTVKALIDNGTCVEVDKVLHWAMLHNNMEKIQVLLEAPNKKFNAASLHAQYILDLALKSRQILFLQGLIDAGIARTRVFEI